MFPRTFKTELDSVISFAPVSSTEGFIGCLDGDSRLSRYKILPNGEINISTISREAVWHDMVYIKKFQILLGVDKSTGHILRLNKSRKLEKIGKAFPGDEPGKCFRITPDNQTLLILTKPYKISAF